MNAMTAWLNDHFQEVPARDFYRVIFPSGALDTKDAFTPGKYTAIAISVSDKKGQDGKRKTCRFTITDDLDTVDALTETDDFCLCAPLSYAGKKRTAAAARMLYAIAVDVDKLVYSKRGSPDGLRSLWQQVDVVHFLPRPTFIVSSGTGLHLYYVLDTPVPLYPDVAREMQEYKRALTRKIWNEAIVNIRTETEIQQEGIYQGFRMPGTITKQGERAIAYRTGERVTLEYLNGFVEDQHKTKKAARAKQRGPVKLAEAAEKWPEWYERRIVRGEKRGVWHTGRALYDWWLRQIYGGAKVGHRYYCVMMLAVYAQKCSMYDEKHNPNPVTWEELERDAYGLVDYLDSMTKTDDNHFGADDVQAALEAFQSRWITYPREAIQGRTGIMIPANKRNGRKQKEHIRIMNFVRDEVNNNKEWRHVQESKEATVIEWRQANPDGSKADCIRETGLSKPTVYKWWTGTGRIDQQQEAAGAAAAAVAAQVTAAPDAAHAKMLEAAVAAADETLQNMGKLTDSLEVTLNTEESPGHSAAQIAESIQAHLQLMEQLRQEMQQKLREVERQAATMPDGIEKRMILTMVEDMQVNNAAFGVIDDKK